MTAFLPARAPRSSIGGRATPRRRRAAQLSFATLVVLAGLAWPVRAEVAPTITAAQHTASMPWSAPWFRDDDAGSSRIGPALAAIAPHPRHARTDVRHRIECASGGGDTPAVESWLDDDPIPATWDRIGDLLRALDPAVPGLNPHLVGTDLADRRNRPLRQPRPLRRLQRHRPGRVLLRRSHRPPAVPAREPQPQPRAAHGGRRGRVRVIGDRAESTSLGTARKRDPKAAMNSACNSKYERQRLCAQLRREGESARHGHGVDAIRFGGERRRRSRSRSATSCGRPPSTGLRVPPLRRTLSEVLVHVEPVIGLRKTRGSGRRAGAHRSASGTAGEVMVGR